MTTTTVDARVRHMVYALFVERARAPSPGQIAQRLGLARDEVEAALRRLAEAHAIVLRAGRTELLMAHPFSAVPTGYQTVVGKRAYVPNCGWDALGIAAMLDEPAHITGRCPDCDAHIQIDIPDAETWSSDLRLHFAVAPRDWWNDIEYT